MKCSDAMIEYMHEYLDNDISPDHEKELRYHLQECEDCQKYFHELKKAEMFVKSSSHITAPSGFVDGVMAKLPKEKRKVSLQRWLKGHPFMTAAALFLILMSGAFLTTWEGDNQQFSVSKQPDLIVENDTVIVPAGKTIEGDVVVRNGNIKIEGTVEGNVTVINGERYMASAGHVSGNIEEVDELFEWLWYNIKTKAKQAKDSFSGLFGS
ncbi:MAG: zf-HC2 domain-containing protein [Bacillus sp. (in: firmicutes)]